MQGGQSYCFPQLIVVLSLSCSCLVSSTPVRWGSSSLNAALWSRRLVLWSTTCPALEGSVCLLRVQLWEFSSLPPPTLLWSRLYSIYPLCCPARLQFTVFFSFAGQFSFGCCSLAQEMSSVVHYLPCFREWLITGPLSAFAAFPVFIYWEFSAEFSSLPPPFSSVVSAFHLPPLLSVFDYSSLFVFQFCWGGRASVCPGSVLVYVLVSG
jgi:hypothetical protein